MSEGTTRENPESYPQKKPYRGTAEEIIAREKASALAYGAALYHVDFLEWRRQMGPVWDAQDDRKREIMGAEEERRRHMTSRDQSRGK